MPETQIRVGDEMIHVAVQVKKRPAVVSFKEILAKAEMVPDYDSNAPWKDCDGYEHEFVPNRDGREDIRDANGYVSRSNRDGGSGLIRLTNPEAWGNFDHWRGTGLSKQVAYELTRLEWARTIKQLVKWYENGWEVYGAVCKYDDYESSVWGVIEPDRAYGKECMREQAEEVAAQMERDGYTIIDRPPESPRLKNGYTRESYRAEMKRKLSLDCWDGETRYHYRKQAADFGEWYDWTEDNRKLTTAGQACIMEPWK
jgi:hypothetical protein